MLNPFSDCASCGTSLALQFCVCLCHIKIIKLVSEAKIAVPVFYLASPRLSSTTPNKALVYDSKVLFPIIHLITVHMGAPGRTHDRQNIQFVFIGDNEKSPVLFT